MVKNPLTEYIQKAKELVHFDRDEHKYTLNGKELISVSRFLSLFKIPFDQDGKILKRCAERDGITPEQLKAKWEETKNVAGDYGTGLHAEIEYYIKSGKVRETKYQQIMKEFKKFKFAGSLHSEVIIYDEEYMLAGTCDLIEYFPKTGSLSLYDMKTNKKLEKYSYWKNKMLYPIEFLDDCNFNSFQLQVSLYAYMLDNQGFWVDNLSIFHVNKKTEIIEEHQIEYKRAEVLAMLEYYEQNGTNRPVDTNNGLDDDFDF